LLDAIEVAVVVFDRTGTVLFANQRAREELSPIGRHRGASGLFEPGFEMVDQAGARLRGSELPSVRTLQSGEVLKDFVMGARSPSGSITWLVVGTAPIMDPSDGSITGAVCTFVDISAQRRAQDALQASEERFRLLAENAADMIYRVRIGPSPAFEYLNPAVQTVIGYSPDELYADLDLIFASSSPTVSRTSARSRCR
jgi:PAS domain-containing protein